MTATAKTGEAKPYNVGMGESSANPMKYSNGHCFMVL